MKLTKSQKIIAQIGFGMVIGFINGFFGGGAGMILVPILVFIYGLEDKKAHATSISIILPLSIISCIVYFFNSKVEPLLCLNVGVGFVLGGIIGALILNKINSKILRIIFSLIMIFCGVMTII